MPADESTPAAAWWSTFSSSLAVSAGVVVPADVGRRAAADRLPLSGPQPPTTRPTRRRPSPPAQRPTAPARPAPGTMLSTRSRTSQWSRWKTMRPASLNWKTESMRSWMWNSDGGGAGRTYASDGSAAWPGAGAGEDPWRSASDGASWMWSVWSSTPTMKPSNDSLSAMSPHSDQTLATFHWPRRVSSLSSAAAAAAPWLAGLRQLMDDRRNSAAPLSHRVGESDSDSPSPGTQSELT